MKERILFIAEAYGLVSLAIITIASDKEIMDWWASGRCYDSIPGSIVLGEVSWKKDLYSTAGTWRAATPPQVGDVYYPIIEGAIYFGADEFVYHPNDRFCHIEKDNSFLQLPCGERVLRSV